MIRKDRLPDSKEKLGQRSQSEEGEERFDSAMKGISRGFERDQKGAKQTKHRL